MFSLSNLKKTKFYQEAQLDTKLEAIPALVQEGLNVEQIARAFKLPLKVVQEVVEKEKTDK